MEFMRTLDSPPVLECEDDGEEEEDGRECARADTGKEWRRVGAGFRWFTWDSSDLGLCSVPF